MPALASSSGGGMDNVLAAMDSVMAFGGKVITFCMDNPLLCFFLACGLVGAGITVLSGLKSFATSR